VVNKVESYRVVGDIDDKGIVLCLLILVTKLLIVEGKSCLVQNSNFALNSDLRNQATKVAPGISAESLT
jgi:hypothetical protein